MAKKVTPNQLLEDGLCRCTMAPKGAAGLEGYQVGEVYRFEKMSTDKNGKPYCRIYPSTVTPDYYETCSDQMFYIFFQIAHQEAEE